MEVRSCLKTAKDIYQGSFDRIVPRSSAVAPSLQTMIFLGSIEGGEERLQRREEISMSLFVNTQNDRDP